MTQPSSSVLFREIHKNAWLKRLPVPEKKALPSIKRGMKVWVVFCVHDDVDPFLEFYLDQEQSAVHKPINSVALNQTLHVSPTICAHEDEFEFVITLQSDIVRLTASSWDQMMEWVESITGKLREMRILSPKENHYSKMPEQRPPLLPTRDPNSPLPLPPLGPASLLPGVEPVLHSDSHSDRNHSASAASVLSPVQMGMIAPSTESSEYTRGLQRLVSRISSLNDPPSELPPPPSSPSPSSSSLPTSPSPVPHNVTVIEVNAASDLPSSSNHHLPSSNQQSSNYTQSSHLPPQSTSQNNVPHHSAASSSSLPMINQPGTSREDSVFNFVFVNEALSPAGEEAEVFFTPPATPGLPGSIARFINPLSGLTAGLSDPFAPLPPAGTGASAADPFSPRSGSAALRGTDPFASLSDTKAAGTVENKELPDTVWDCREEDVKLWNCREGEVKVWDCREEDLQVWDCREDATPVRKNAVHVVSVSSDSQINIVPPPPVRQLSRVSNPSKTPLASVESVSKPRSPLTVPVSCSSISQVSVSSHPLVSASKPSNVSSHVNVKSSYPAVPTKPANHASSFNVITQNASTTCLSLSNTSSSVPAPPGPSRTSVTSTQLPQNNRLAYSVSMASNVLVQPPSVSNSGIPHHGVNAPSLSSIPSASPSSNAKPTPPPHANGKSIPPSHANSKPIPPPLSNPKSVPPPLTHPKSISPPIILNKAAPTSPCRPRRNSTSNEVAPSSDATSNGHANLYEHLFPPSDASTGNNGEPNSTANNNQVKSNARSRPVTVNPQPNRPRRRSASNSETSGHLPHVPADRIRTVSQRSQQQPVPARLGPTPAVAPPQSSPPDAPLVNPSRLTLREQQVLQLRREMMHPGGVRLQLRRKDCVNSIALVDAFNAVWIAGWKQKEHPMLYNALHIGDQVLKIMGQFVQNAADAQKLIRSKHGIYVEFVVLRVPRGRVYALCREQQGQSLGIVQEGSAEIKDIVPGSLVAQHGIPLRCPTMDGLALTSWWITEVNGRPLNLFFKDNEVKDRLNCVGLDISLLLQPFDLIKQIRKQMKSSIRSYKDYIVQ